ncbi:hypothetical protein R6Q59_012778 [Mikania micrantha]
MDFLNFLSSSKLNKELVLSVIQTTVWCIWKARNEVTFRQARIIKEKIVEDVKVLSYFWVKNRKRRSNLDWVSLLFFDVG